MGQIEETRLDIDPGASPHIVANMTDMRDLVESESYDSVYTCHALEHLHLEDARLALMEFRRVVKPGGFLMVIVPDLEGVSANHDTLYVSAAGPITGHDLYFGYAPYARHNPHMQHRSGFVQSTLTEELKAAGFSNVLVRRLPDFNLCGVAVK